MVVQFSVCTAVPLHVRVTARDVYITSDHIVRQTIILYYFYNLVFDSKINLANKRFSLM